MHCLFFCYVGERKWMLEEAVVGVGMFGVTCETGKTTFLTARAAQDACLARRRWWQLRNSNNLLYCCESMSWTEEQFVTCFDSTLLHSFIQVFKEEKQVFSPLYSQTRATFSLKLSSAWNTMPQKTPFLMQINEWRKQPLCPIYFDLIHVLSF